MNGEFIPSKTKSKVEHYFLVNDDARLMMREALDIDWKLMAVYLNSVVLEIIKT